MNWELHQKKVTKNESLARKRKNNIGNTCTHMQAESWKERDVNRIKSSVRRDNGWAFIKTVKEIKAQA